MSRLLISLLVSAGLGVALSVAAQTSPTSAPGWAASKDAYIRARTNADAQYKVDKDACSSLAGNAKDICVTQAKGRDATAKADAAAAFQNTPRAREHARVAHADANYRNAIEKCDDLAGNTKDVCVKEAKAAFTKGKAEAKVDRVTADTRTESATKRMDAREEANTDIRDAEYQVAKEKCDALAGSAKESCVSGAKVQYGKS
jgi:hypothetical protein